jgi:hypothetical protein
MGSTLKLRQLLKVSGQEQVHFQSNDQVYFVLDQHAKLDLYSASSMKQQYNVESGINYHNLNP